MSSSRGTHRPRTRGAPGAGMYPYVHQHYVAQMMPNHYSNYGPLYDRNQQMQMSHQQGYGVVFPPQGHSNYTNQYSSIPTFSPQYVPQQMGSIRQPQMSQQHTAASPTPQQLAQDQTPLPTPPQTYSKPAPAKPRPNAITIKDPNSGRIISASDLNKKEEPVVPAEQEIKTKKVFKEKVVSRARGPSQSDPNSVPSSPKQQAGVVRNAEKPAAPSSEKRDSLPHPTAILQNNRSALEAEKTSENTEVKEINLQTTGSAPLQPSPQPKVPLCTTETDGAVKTPPEILNIPGPKMQGETIIIDSTTTQKPAQEESKVNGVKAKPEPPVEDITSSEESSECKDQFETPPATPSEVKPERQPLPKPEEKTPEAVPSKLMEVAAPDIQVEDLEEGELAAEEEEEVATPVERKPYRYTKEEMLPFRESQDKPPANLPQLDCILDKPILKTETPRGSSRTNNQFIPDWDQRTKNRSQHRNRSMDKNYMNKPRIIDHVMQFPVVRKKSQNAWLSKREGGEEKDSDDMKNLKGQVTAILNKITPQNFKDLSVQILQLQINTMKMLEVAVEIIFEKAILEPAFSQTYANLCKVMSSIKIPEEANAKVSPFRKTLLNRCQKEFFREKDDEKLIDGKIKQTQEDKTLTDQKRQDELEELYYQRSKLKKKMLGNINFIGELYNLNMISAKIIQMQCITNLIDKKNTGHLDDESIECLAKLFTTVGSKLEGDASEDDKKKQVFEDSYAQFKSLANDKNYPYRIRFMIQDVADLRDNGWKPRRQEAKPQKIDDIHREHAKEEQERKMEAAVAQQQSRKISKRNDSMRNSRDGRDKDWPGQGIKKVNTNFDMNKLSNPKLDSGSIVLGPSRHAWGKGSGTGSGTNSPSGSIENLSAMKSDGLKNKTLLPGKTTSAPGPRAQAAERQATIAAARGFAPPKRNTSPSPVRNQPRDKLTDSQLKSKTKSILTEYFDIEEIEEAVDCIKTEMGLVKKHHLFIEESINIILDNKPKTHGLLGDLYAALFEEKPPLMHADGLLTGFQPAFEMAEELAIDVPGIYNIFGTLLGKCIAREHISFQVVKDALNPLKASKKAGKVMCEILKNAINDLGDQGKMIIQQRWAKEKMVWSDFCSNHDALIKEYEMEFLSSSDTGSKVEAVLSDIKLFEKLSDLLSAKRISFDDVFDMIEGAWGKKLTSDNIKKLVDYTCRNLVVYQPHTYNDTNPFDKQELQAKYAPLLKRYLQAGEAKENSELQLHALDAIQLYIHTISFPRNLAYNLFVELEEMGIVSAEGFKHWHKFGLEQQGHGVIRQSLKQFFSELDSNDDSDNQ